jgi:hypothetical protein
MAKEKKNKEIKETIPTTISCNEQKEKLSIKFDVMALDAQQSLEELVTAYVKASSTIQLTKDQIGKICSQWALFTYYGNFIDRSTKDECECWRKIDDLMSGEKKIAVLESFVSSLLGTI